MEISERKFINKELLYICMYMYVYINIMYSFSLF